MRPCMTNPSGETPAADAAGLTVFRLFRAQVATDRSATALQQDGRCWSYGELDAWAARIAGLFAARGVGRGDRVALLSENGAAYVAIQLACARLGAIVACQNWRLADDQLRHCIQLCTPSLLLVSERYADVARRIDHGVPAVLTLGAAFDQAVADTAEGVAPEDAARPEDGIVILYTSGTTGMPKGALISHRAMIARAMVNGTDGAIVVLPAFLAWAPLFHMVSTDNALAALMRGGKVIVTDGFDAAELVRIVAAEEIGWLNLMPGMIDAVLDELDRTGAAARGIRTLGCMPDLMPRRQIARLTERLGAPFVNSFGSTETGAPPGSRSLIAVGDAPAGLPKTLNSFCAIRLVDEEDRDVRDGEPGELLFRGPTLFSGYWNAPVATAEAFRGGWFRMGDMFRRNPDGTLSFVDRRKYLIKSGGENIYPAEVEQVLRASPRVADAVVVRRPDDRWGEVPVAFVVPADPEVTAAEVIAFCRGRIAGYKLPKEVRFVAADALPRNTTGKILRHELEALLAIDRGDTAAAGAGERP